MAERVRPKSMNNRSQLNVPDAASVPVLNWRTATGLDYASFSVRGEEAGGDYIDFVPMANGEFALMLGETDAKGQAADWTSACLKGAVRGFVARGEVNPMRLVNDLNRIIYDLCSIEQVVSFLYAHYSARTGVLTYVNAGHEAALLLQDGRRGTSLLDLSGPVLGLKATSAYSEGAVKLRSGDRLIAFTTGLIDALACEPEGSAEEELLDIAREYEEADSRDLAGAILHRIAQAQLSDTVRDRSLVVVSRSGALRCAKRNPARRELAFAN